MSAAFAASIWPWTVTIAVSDCSRRVAKCAVWQSWDSTSGAE
ncbi:hypothetical protein [Mycolicibacterium celeriflavum]